MTAYFAGGDAANAVWCAHTLVATPTADALFPDAHFLSNNLGELFRFGSVATDPEVVVDMNMLYDGGFEVPSNNDPPSAVDPKGRPAWTIEAGSPDVSTAAPNTGSNSLRLNASTEAVYYDIPVIAGNTYRWDGYLRGSGSVSARVEIINLDTGSYLQNGGTWSASQTYLHTRSTASYGQDVDTFTVEAPRAGESARMTLRLRCSVSGSGTVYFDDLSIFPKIDTAALLCARYGNQMDAEIWYADDSAGADHLAGTLPHNGLRSFVTLTAPDPPERWYRLFFDGSAGVRTVDLAQLWLFERQEFVRAPSAKVDTTHRTFRAGAGGGDFTDRSKRQGRTARLTHPLKWSTTSELGLDQIIEDFYEASGGGEQPCLVIPDTTRTERVLHGRVPQEIMEKWLTQNAFEMEVPFVEDAMPALTT